MTTVYKAYLRDDSIVLVPSSITLTEVFQEFRVSEYSDARTVPPTRTQKAVASLKPLLPYFLAASAGSTAGPLIQALAALLQ